MNVQTLVLLFPSVAVRVTDVFPVIVVPNIGLCVTVTGAAQLSAVEAKPV